MDDGDPLLSHQALAVRALAPFYSHIFVLTGRVGKMQHFPNVTVVSTHWSSRRKLRNFQILIYKFVKLLLTEKIDLVFFHMTDVQAAITAPIAKIFRVPSYLWYAHTHRSGYLIWANLWIKGIITSTKGSCPLSGKRVHAIGQGVDSKTFHFVTHNRGKLQKIIHIGRFDESKNIEVLVETAKECRSFDPKISFTQIGSPGNPRARDYANEVLFRTQGYIKEGWLSIFDSVDRSKIPGLMENFDVFLHGYNGSLDKTLIEATLCGIPVVTSNPEYLRLFGNWNGSTFKSLQDDLGFLLTLDSDSVHKEVLARWEIAEKHHSLNNWVRNLNSTLQNSM
jgi:glycosyltransferase involved in cell wall biosynthesis